MVEREDLREMPDQIGGPLQETQILDWITQVCNALEYLHSHNPPIIHRDIKPANIKITPGAKAMLVDFGIAKVFDPKLSTTMGARAFRPGYFPQEQYGMGATDWRLDSSEWHSGEDMEICLLISTLDCQVLFSWMVAVL